MRELELGALRSKAAAKYFLQRSLNGRDWDPEATQAPKRPASPGKERLSAVARAIGKRLRSPKKTYESTAEKRASHGGDVPKEVRMAAVGEYEKLAVNGKLPRGAASRLVARLSSYSISIRSVRRWVHGTTTPATGATASVRNWSPDLGWVTYSRFL